MRPPSSLSKLLLQFVFLLLMASFIAGCAVKWVADYDAVTFEEILKVGKSVDRFYGDLLEIKPAERVYAKFSDRYVGLETDIRSLVTRNQARALNTESIQISEIILKLLVKYKENHKSNDTYLDRIAKLDRNRSSRSPRATATVQDGWYVSDFSGDSKADLFRYIPQSYEAQVFVYRNAVFGHSKQITSRLTGRGFK